MTDVDDEKAESSAPSVLALAEEVLLEEFQRRVVADPQSALETVDRLVMGMHSASCGATNTARKAGASWHEIGRAHAALEGAGILLRQAAALFLALPAADQLADLAALGVEWAKATPAPGQASGPDRLHGRGHRAPGHCPPCSGPAY
uniref:hypothetical protein n=2 Tax=Streptomyces rimosus TaxID=1927 RepID=UPI001C7347C5|nr:hypothetical protein [Streptomyces rimosus]